MTAKAALIELGEAPFARGDRVEISEEGIRPWTGTVTAVKPSSVSGWWIEVLRDDGTGTWSISVLTDIRLLAKEEEPKNPWGGRITPNPALRLTSEEETS